MTDASVTDDAQRARWAINSNRYRRRRQRGIHRRCLSIEDAKLDRLEERGYLDPDRRGDRVEEAVALEAFIEDYL